MFRKNRATRTLLAILTVITVFISEKDIRLYASGAHDGVLTDRAEHTDLSFSEFEYKRVEKSELEDIVSGLGELTSDAANSDAVMDVITAMEDFANELSRNYTIANINSSLYADDDKYDEEVKYYSTLADECGDIIMQSYKTVALSPCSEALKERVNDDREWADILEYENMTDEQKELSKKETELSLKYDDLSLKKYTCKIDGNEYDKETIEKAVSNGKIDYYQYMEGLSEIENACNKEKAELFIELVGIRNEIAKSYGYDNYIYYAYDKIYKRDYTPDELDSYREGVAQNLVPLSEELYDLLYNEHADEVSAMLKKKMSEDECLEKLKKHLPEISSDLMLSYDYMTEHGLYDISVSEHKAPGGFTVGVCGYNAPFLYNCADGNASDMRTLIHEFGHYNQMYYQSDKTWYYSKNNLDLAEIHSQGLELLFQDYAEDIYGNFGDTMNIYNHFNLIYSAVEGVKEDEFQRMVYEDEDGLTISELNSYYYDCCEKYGSLKYYNSYYLGSAGYMNEGEIGEWTEIPHTFQSPFYYISYSLSVSAVYELYDRILEDRDEGIDLYLALVNAEFKDSFQDTLDNVGLNNPVKNPRFDLYADDIRVSVGLDEKGHEDYDSTDSDHEDFTDEPLYPTPGTYDDHDADIDHGDYDDYYDQGGFSGKDLRMVYIFCAVLIGITAFFFVAMLGTMAGIIMWQDKKALKKWEKENEGNTGQNGM